MTQVLAGAAVAFAQRREERAALVFERWSAIETGAWHEGMNFAAAQRAPIIAVLGPPEGRGRPRRAGIEAVARCYGVGMLSIGEDALASVLDLVAEARLRAVKGEGPTVIALAARGGVDPWASYDAFAQWALAEGGRTRNDLDAIERAAAAGIDHALGRIVKEPGPDPEDALAAVSTGSPPIRPWTRLKSPRPDGLVGAALSGAPDVH